MEHKHNQESLAKAVNALQDVFLPEPVASLAPTSQKKRFQIFWNHK